MPQEVGSREAVIQMSVLHEAAFPIERLSTCSSLESQCILHLGSKYPKADKVIIPDLFVSFVSQRPKPNPYYELVKSQSETWMMEYDIPILSSIKRLIIEAYVIGVRMSIRSMYGQTFHTLRQFGQQRLARKSFGPLWIGATGKCCSSSR